MDITSAYCPREECVFYDSSSKLTLDLRLEKGKRIKAINEDLSFVYTPCQNAGICGIWRSLGMALQFDANNGMCKQVIATWDPIALPTYNSQENSWYFSYRNDDFILDVYWICQANQTNR